MSFFFATRAAPGAPLHARRARAEQSADANALLGGLREASGLANGPYSKSHSRAFSAAAVAGSGRAGIDIEWTGAVRDQAGMSRYLLDCDAGADDALGLFRAWTFYEAYFKAFGDYPDLTQRRAVFFGPRVWDAAVAQAGASALFQRLDGDFLLCALWDGGGEICELRI